MQRSGITPNSFPTVQCLGHHTGVAGLSFRRNSNSGKDDPIDCTIAFAIDVLTVGGRSTGWRLRPSYIPLDTRV
jgi:hypothetical protein